MKERKDKEYSYFSALMLAEEGLQLVVRSGLVAVTLYLIGTLPFITGAIYFWSAMKFSSEAQRYASPGALGLAVLFVWMKTFQSRYGQHLRKTLMDGELSPWTVGAFYRTLCRQAALHATVVIVYPVAAVTVLPMAYVVAWYQNLTLLEDGGTASLLELARDAARQAALWPRQNHTLLWLASPLMPIVLGVIFLVTFPVLDGLEQGMQDAAFLLSFGWIYGGLLLAATLPLAPVAMALMIGISATIYFGIEFFHMLTGAETLYTRNPMALLDNSTLLALVCSLTYVALDPVLKAAYSIRCHEGASFKSGDDLRVVLQRIKRSGARGVAAALALVVAGLFFQPGLVHAQTAPDSPASQLDQALQKELTQARYTWRMPREARSSGELPWILQTILDFGRDFRESVKSALIWIRDTWEDLRSFFDPEDSVGGPRGLFSGVNPSLRLLAALAGIALLIAMTYLVWISFRRSRGATLVASTPLEARPPDIEDEATTATDLPEDEWLVMAQQLAAAGEFRPAARALFFSMLATLARFEVIRIARFKCNRDYQSEMARRASSLGEAPKYFARIALTYESVWYGEHKATAETLSQMQADRERLHHAME